VITVRKLLPEDMDKAAELEQVCFSRPWSKRELSASAGHPCAVYLAALDGGEVIGYAGMYVAAEAAEINNIAVFPEYRRRGAATALINGLVDACKERGVKKLSLDVRESNTAALCLYEKNGFFRVGKRRGYYTAPKEDAVLLDKDI
jgi:ribosomal-protein-alanine N-acetyltransferase